MTLVNVETFQRHLGGAIGTAAKAVITYWRGYGPYVQVQDENVIFPGPITVTFDTGTGWPSQVVDLEPTLGVACVKWEITTPTSPVALVIYTEIPQTGPVDFEDLKQVDPHSLQPGENVAAWDAILAEIAALASAAAASASDSETSATNSATSATASAGSATQSANSASNSAASASAAAGSASAAAGSATAASGSAGDAAGSATAAAGSATAAQVARTGAETAQTGAQTAQTAAETARNETIVSVASQSDWSGAVTITSTQSRSGYLRRRLTGNATITVNAGTASQAYSCSLELQQDATGSRTIVLANVATPYGVAIPLSSAANAVDIIRLEWNGLRWAAYLGGTQLVIPTTWIV